MHAAVMSAAAPARRVFPGLLACAVVAAAASFLGEHYGAPTLLFALLLGMAMNFLSDAGSPCNAGIAFTGRTVLRLGVALLGLRITVGQIAALGWQPLAIVVVAVVLTIAVSMLAARLLGFQALFGLLSGGATAICGASAAMALAAALPAHPLKERATLFTIVGVSLLSTSAMVAYPMLVHAFGLDARLAGIFIGGTIHDVAQVVGAGYSVSREAGDIATFVKLLRVAMLLPVILFAALLTRSRGGAGPRPPLLPGFVIGFGVLVLVGSSGWLAPVLVRAGSELSRWCLVAAIAAIGMKTQLRELASVGLKPVLLMFGETLFLAALVLLMLRLAF